VAQKGDTLALQILTLKLDGITAGDYLSWCRDPDPPALDFALRSLCVDADPLGDTVTAILDWNRPAPAPAAAAAAAGLPLAASVELRPSMPTEVLDVNRASVAQTGAQLACESVELAAPATLAR
jgi:hypothetical protein